MTIASPRGNDDAPIGIAVLCFPGVQATAVHGLTDLFAYANHHAQELSAAATPPLLVRHWHPDAAGTMRAEGDGAATPPALVLIPPAQAGPVPPGSQPAALAWLREQHAAGAILAAVCGGVFLLAETGLLARRPAATHPIFADELRRRFPAVLVDADRLVIDDGDIVTAAGVLAWASLGLALVGRLLGPSVLASTARFMLVDPAEREGRCAGGFTPDLRHGDRAVLAVQHWLRTQTHRPVTLAELARRAVLGERTLLRRFTRATGLCPVEYHLRLRIARSQQLLEHGDGTVEQVALAVGYQDAGGFRRLFKRVVGLSPADYRRRFGHRQLRAKLRLQTQAR